MVLGKLGLELGNPFGKLMRDRKKVQWNQSCIYHQNQPISSEFNHHRNTNVMKGHGRLVANHKRQSINETHTTSYLQSLKEKLGELNIICIISNPP